MKVEGRNRPWQGAGARTSALAFGRGQPRLIVYVNW